MQESNCHSDERAELKTKIFDSPIYVSSFSYDHEIWVITEILKLRIQVTEMKFPCRVAGISQLRWVGHLQGCLLGGSIQRFFRDTQVLGILGCTQNLV